MPLAQGPNKELSSSDSPYWQVGSMCAFLFAGLADCSAPFCLMLALLISFAVLVLKRGDTV